MQLIKKQLIKSTIAVIALVIAVGGVPRLTLGNTQNKKNIQDKSDTLYGIGSISKLYVTVAMMQLVDQGKVDLDEPVIKYIPEFTMADERYKQITVRMLLNHSSGIMGSSFSNNILFEDNDQIAHDTLLEKLKIQRLKADPGQYGTYCNDGFELAELIVERVSGESFSEYLLQHICGPLGMSKSGTAINYLDDPYQVLTYYDDSTLYATEYCNVFGAGGVLSTAEEVCLFSQTFMKDNNHLLKDDSIKEMQSPGEGSYGYVAAGSWDHYGLGWDSVDAEPFNQYGITALLKGGDILKQHAMLIVLPDENISVSVLSSGGSSTFNGLLAQELAKITLEEEGILKEEDMKDKTPINDSKVESDAIVPQRYLKYEGIYANNTGFYRISFPDKKHLQLEDCDTEIPKVQIYHYTGEDSFVSENENYISGTGMASADGRESGQTILSFKTEKDGKEYVCMDSTLNYAEIGSGRIACMFAEKIRPNQLNDSVMKDWKVRDGKKYYLIGEKYSSAFWSSNPMIKIKLSTQQDGYINASGRMSTTQIVNGNEAEAFVTLTGLMGSDLSDISFSTKQGKEALYLKDMDLYFIEESAISDLDLTQNKIEVNEAKVNWYKVTDQLAKRKIVLNPAKQMAIYVYNQYDECIYSTYMKNVGNQVILPKGGKMAVIGEPGSVLQFSEN